MKKLFLILALCASTFFADAQKEKVFASYPVTIDQTRDSLFMDSLKTEAWRTYLAFKADSVIWDSVDYALTKADSILNFAQKTKKKEKTIGADSVYQLAKENREQIAIIYDDATERVQGSVDLANYAQETYEDELLIREAIAKREKAKKEKKFKIFKR